MKQLMPFLRNPWVIILLLIFFSPIGLVLMWRLTRWSTGVKVIILFLCFFSIIGSLNASTSFVMIELIIAGVIYFMFGKEEVPDQSFDAKKQEAIDFVKNVQNDLSLPAIDVDLQLHNDEKCYFTEDNVEFAEERSISQRKGFGSSTRIIKGLWLHQNVSVSTSMPELRKLDTGTLFITSDRIIFLGHNRHRAILLKDILTTTVYIDALAVTQEKNEKNEFYYVRNPILVKAVLSVMPTIRELESHAISPEDMKRIREHRTESEKN